MYDQFLQNQVVIIFGYILSAIASIFIICSYIFRKPSKIIFFQFLGSITFAICGVFLGQLVGAMINIICSARCLFFYFKKKKHWIWPALFLLLSTVPYILTFTALKNYVYPDGITPIRYFIDALPLIGMAFTTISFFLKDEKKIKALAICSCPFWMTYDFLGGVRFNIGGIVCDAISVIIVVTSLIINRHNKSIKE